MNLLSGVTWKGVKLRIGEAKPDFHERCVGHFGRDLQTYSGRLIVSREKMLQTMLERMENPLARKDVYQEASRVSMLRTCPQSHRRTSKEGEAGALLLLVA